MPPEALGFIPERRFPYAGDMWALGVVAFLLLTNRLPFEDLDDLHMFVQGDLKFPADPLFELDVSNFGISFLMELMWPLPGRRLTAGGVRGRDWMTSPIHDANMDHYPTMSEEMNASSFPSFVDYGTGEWGEDEVDPDPEPLPRATVHQLTESIASARWSWRSTQTNTFLAVEASPSGETDTRNEVSTSAYVPEGEEEPVGDAAIDEGKDEKEELQASLSNDRQLALTELVKGVQPETEVSSKTALIPLPSSEYTACSHCGTTYYTYGPRFSGRLQLCHERCSRYICQTCVVVRFQRALRFPEERPPRCKVGLPLSHDEPPVVGTWPYAWDWLLPAFRSAYLCVMRWERGEATSCCRKKECQGVRTPLILRRNGSFSRDCVKCRARYCHTCLDCVHNGRHSFYYSHVLGAMDYHCPVAEELERLTL